ncbi:MAG: UDP-N-acetylmuramoyl-L-alanine--D-glutamate ligase [Chloroflexota bacterium]
MNTRPELAGQRAVIVGLGREGRDLARFLARSGALVHVTDSRPEEALAVDLTALAELPLGYTLGGHAVHDLDTADVVYVSPGVPPEIPFLLEARQRGIRISSATELFFHYCPGTILGITGSSGKSTTTAMTGKVLQAAGRDAVIGGNIGVPMLGLLDRISEQTLVVMELSSFQLESLMMSPPIATVTNITPNHLDRHVTMDAYIRAKSQILDHQSPGNWAIVNRDDPESQRLKVHGHKLQFSQREPVLGAFQAGSELHINLGNGTHTVCSRHAIQLRGEHNVANALAVIATAAAAGIDSDAIRHGIEAFRALPHRLEPVGEIAGVTYFNDSIATSPERSIAALESFGEPMVLLAGGRDKYLPMDHWAAVIQRRAHHLVVFGEAAPLIRQAAISAGIPASRISEAMALEDAVDAAVRVAHPGDVVLLSPGCTSYDAFFDFEERGERFRQLVTQHAGDKT